MMKKTLMSLCLLGLIGTTNAHVTVRNFANGVDSLSGKSDSFRLNVPTNRPKAITKIDFVVADDVKLLFIHPMPNWTYTTVKYKAYVTYEDGVVVPFDGSPEAHGYQPTILLK